MDKRIGLSLLLGVGVAYGNSVGVVAQFDPAQGWTNPLHIIKPLAQIQGVQVAGAGTSWLLGGNDNQGQESMVVNAAGQPVSVTLCPFHNIFAVTPAYPETGESSAAWVITPPMGADPIQSYYFDGREWSAPQTLDSYPSGFRSSEGHGWIVNSGSNGGVQLSYFDAGSRTWVPIHDLVLSSDLSDAAGNGYFYVLSEDQDTHDLTMYRIDGVGHWQQLSLAPITTQDMHMVTILAEGTRVFLYRLNGVDAIAYYSNDSGLTWNDVSQNAPPASPRKEASEFSMANGVVRVPGADAYTGVIDLKAQNPIWQNIELPPSYYEYFTFYPDVSADGSEHCEFLISPADAVSVGCYDVGTQAWNVTPAISLAHPDMTMIAALGHDKVAFVGQDADGVETGYYYDGHRWIINKFSGVVRFSGSETTGSFFNVNNIWAGGAKS